MGHRNTRPMQDVRLEQTSWGRNTGPPERLERKRGHLLEDWIRNFSKSLVVGGQRPDSGGSPSILLLIQRTGRRPNLQPKFIVVISAIALLASCAAGPAFRPADVFDFVSPVAPGQPVTFGFPIGPVIGRGPVTLERASVERLPKEMEVVGIWAFKPSDFGSSIGVLAGDYPKLYPERLRPRPVDGIVLENSEFSEWHLAIVLSSSVPGIHAVQGVRLTYSVGGRRGSQFFPAEMKLEVLECDPQSSDPVCEGKPDPLPILPSASPS